MMELVKFRVKNYRSIIDSGDCYLANKITVLAGKNESGKSSILEALEDFENKKEIRKSAIPIHDEPGLFLHATAQKDILGKLEACASRTPIIFSTHSPYLDSNKLNRVRLVTRTDDEGTKITKLHAGADKCIFSTYIDSK